MAKTTGDIYMNGYQTVNMDKTKNRMNVDGSLRVMLYLGLNSNLKKLNMLFVT